MKIFPDAFAAHLSGEVTTLATCWKLTRRDASVFAFTDHDRDLLVGGITYLAEAGFTPTSIRGSADLSVDNLEAQGMLSAESITETDLLAGRFDFAEVEIFLVNYREPEQGRWVLRTGWLGEVRLERGRFAAEIRGLSQAFAQATGELYSPACRATLGDSRCKVDLAAHRVTGSVSAVAPGERASFIDTGRSEQSGVFTGGVLTFTSGANAGLSGVIKEHRYAMTGATLTLSLPLATPIEAGASYLLSKGCDKTLGTCHQRFGNVINFRGEPHIPGIDRMLETAGTRSGG